MKNITKKTEKYINNGIFFHFTMIDEKDRQILEELKQNSKLTTGQLSKKLNIPITTVHNRIKRMEKNKIIKGYTLNINYKKLGINLSAYVLVSTKTESRLGKKINQEDVARNMKKINGIEEVDTVTGTTDLMAHILAKDVSEFNDLLVNKIKPVEGVDKTQSMLVLKRI